MRTLIAAVIILAVAVPNAVATEQFPDRMLYKGKEYVISPYPMESYFEKHPGKKPTGGIVSSALWRGYVATLELKGKDIDEALLARQGPRAMVALGLAMRYTVDRIDAVRARAKAAKKALTWKVDASEVESDGDEDEDDFLAEMSSEDDDA